MANPISARDHRVLGVELTIDRILEFAGNPAISSVSRRFQVYNERLLRNKWQQVATRIESLPILNGYLLALPSLPRNPSKRFEALNKTLTKYIEPEILEALNFKNRRPDEQVYIELEQRLKDISLLRAWGSIRHSIRLDVNRQALNNIPSKTERSVVVIREFLNNPANERIFSQVTGFSFLRKGLYVIPEEIKKFTHITDLCAFHNKIQSVSGSSFQGLTRLRTLSLSFNQITHLPGKFFEDLRNCVWINLDNNAIEELPQEVTRALFWNPIGIYFGRQKWIPVTQNPIVFHNFLTSDFHKATISSQILAVFCKFLISLEFCIRIICYNIRELIAPQHRIT